MGEKKKILIIMGRYLPGFKDGGPVRSIINLTDYMGDEYEFRILTCDRDHGDTEPYPNIKVNEWNQVRKAKVYYVPPKGFTFKIIKTLVSDVDLVYVCGIFNDYAISTLVLNRLKQIKKPVVVASMGLFSPLEFRLKYRKKKMFTTIFNMLGMFKHIYWSATSEMEILEILQQVSGNRNQFFIAEDLPRIVSLTPIHKTKENGVLEVVWISRIAPKKNLLGAIEVLKLVKSQIIFTIYGPVHVETYWEECQKKLRELPSNVKWEYKGNVDSEQVVSTLKKHHVFLFPTFGENYGHVIQEALSAGCACVLSDQTPWKNLEENGIGYIFKVNDKNKFALVIDEYASMSQEQIQKVSDDALQYAIDNSNEKVRTTGYKKIFELV